MRLTGDLTSSGVIQLTPFFGNGGGSVLAVAGTLTNSGTLQIASPYDALSAADTVSAAHLINTGTLALFGHLGALAEVEVTGDAAPTIFTGTVQLNGNAQFDYGAGGGIVIVAANATLALSGAAARLSRAGTRAATQR